MNPSERAVFDAEVDMRYIPEEAFYVARYRPAEIFASEGMKLAAKEVDKIRATEPGHDIFHVEEIETVLQMSYATEQGAAGTRIVYRMVKPASQAKTDQFIQASVMDNAELVEVKHPMGSYYHQKDAPNGKVSWRIGERTFVFDTSAASLKRYLDRLESGSKPPTWLGDAKPDAQTQLWLAVNAKKIVLPADGDAPSAFSGDFPMEMIAPLFRDMKRVVASIQIAPTMSVDADADCSSPEAAGRVKETTSALLVMVRNLLAVQLQTGAPEKASIAVLAPASKFIEPLLASASVHASGSQVKLIASDDSDVAEWIQEYLPAIQAANKKASNAVNRARRQNNLKDIAIAMLNYESAYGHYPPAVLYDEKTGTPYSWRVAILPFMKQHIHGQYQFSEPWDSEHNLKISKMVMPTYSSPNGPISNKTAYFVLTGPETVFAFEGMKGTQLRGVIDGLSNTILVVEAERDVPWTKPEDIPYSPDKRLPKLGGISKDGFYAAFCDGSVHFLHEDIDQQTLRHLIEKADRNVIDRSEF